MAKKTVIAPDLGTSPTKRIAFRRIKAAAYNPRVALEPGDPDYEKLARSIDEFGLVEPLIWNKQTGNLVGGHQRMAILKARGVKSADVVVVDLTPLREKALNLALNKITGRWDTDKLAGVLDELAEDDSIDELLTGFDAKEIDNLLAGMDDEGDGKTGESNAGAKERRSQKAAESSFQVVVICTDEADQAVVHKLLKEHGHACRVLTLY